jgi:hypothetical protein
VTFRSHLTALLEHVANVLAKYHADRMNPFVPVQPLFLQSLERFDDLFTQGDLVFDNNMDGSMKPRVRQRDATTTMVRSHHFESISLSPLQPLTANRPDLRIVFFQGSPFWVQSS